MPHIVVIGSGITGVTSAYELMQRGYKVTVVDRHLYPAMETSYANGGQLSASNAESWNHKTTVLKSLKWMMRKDAPLLLNPSFHLQKYKWLAEFLLNIKHYENNTIDTAKMALLAQQHLLDIAKLENIDFDLEQRGILHLYHNEADLITARRVNELLCKGGLERHEVSSDEIHDLEPNLMQNYYAGFYTPNDASGDIHKFTTRLAQVTEKQGVKYLLGKEVVDIKYSQNQVIISYCPSAENMKNDQYIEHLQADAILICAGVGSYQLSLLLGDQVNVYPVKGYSITINLRDEQSIQQAPWMSLLDEEVKIVASRLGEKRLRIAGTAEFNGYNRDIRADRIQPLLNWANQNFDISTEYVVPWAGLRPMMPNMMPVVRQGKHQRVFYNTGHGHLGWTLSAVTALMITQEIEQNFPA